MMAGSGSGRPKNVWIRIHNTGPKFFLYQMEEVKFCHVLATKSVGQIMSDFRGKIRCLRKEITIFRKLTVSFQESNNFNEFSKEQNFEISRSCKRHFHSNLPSC